MTAALVGLGGAAGAVARFLVDRRLTAHRAGQPLPLATLLVNLVGAALLGLLLGLAAAGIGPGWLSPLLVTGFCGALTTYSTFSADTVRLLEERRPVLAISYSLGSLTAGLALAATGWAAAGLVA